MRLPAVAASVLAIGLVAAACGGDGATTAPAATKTPGASATTAPAGETSEPGAADATEGTAAEPTEAAVSELGKKAIHASTDDPEATYGLIDGRYRLAWKSSCDAVEVAVVQVDGDFEFVWPSQTSNFNATVNDVPDGHFRLEQRNPDCTTWTELRMDWMTANR